MQPITYQSSRLEAGEPVVRTEIRSQAAGDVITEVPCPARRTNCGQERANRAPDRCSSARHSGRYALNCKHVPVPGIAEEHVVAAVTGEHHLDASFPYRS